MWRSQKILLLIGILCLTTGCKYNSILVETRLRSTILPVDLLGKIHIQDRVNVDVERNASERRMKMLDAWLEIKKAKKNEDQANTSP